MFKTRPNSARALLAKTNVCANMAARFLLTLRSFILILGLWTALLQKEDIDSVYNNLSRHGRCKWQGFYYLLSIFGHLYYMNFRAAMKCIYANSNSEVTFSAFKGTKHETDTLVLPARIFWTDLTIHMDVKANPGPGIDKVNVTLWKPSSIRSQFKSSAAVINYLRTQILSLRSKYQISEELYHFLEDHKILRTRGIRGGISARQRYNQISILSRGSFRRNYSSRGVNGNNLRFVECVNRRPAEQPSTSKFLKSKLQIAHLNVRSVKERNHFNSAQRTYGRKELRCPRYF